MLQKGLEQGAAKVISDNMKQNNNQQLISIE